MRPLLTLAGTFGIWQLLVWLADLPPYILPGPWGVLVAGWENAALIAGHAAITALEILIGLALGIALGIATALQLMLSPLARRMLLPILAAGQSIPVFALAPLLTLWLGYGLAGKVVIAVLIIYFPITSTFYDGLRATPHGFIDLARSLRATPRRMLFQVRVPAALPSLAAGLRLAAVYAPIGAIIGEWVGAAKGLGYLMLLANSRADIDLMFAALLVLCCGTLLLRAAMNQLGQVLTAWARL